MASNDAALVFALFSTRQSPPYDALEWVRPTRHVNTTEDAGTAPLQVWLEDVVLHQQDGHVGAVVQMYARVLYLNEAITPLCMVACREAELIHPGAEIGMRCVRACLATSISFPIRLCDVPADALIQWFMCVGDALVPMEMEMEEEEVAASAVAWAVGSPFTVDGVLRTGSTQLVLHPAHTPATMDEMQDCAVVGERQQPAWRLLAEDWREGRMDSVPWLDAITAERLRKLEHQDHDDRSSFVSSNNNNNMMPASSPARCGGLLRLRYPILSTPRRVMIHRTHPSRWLTACETLAPPRRAAFHASSQLAYADLCPAVASGEGGWSRSHNLAEASAALSATLVLLLRHHGAASAAAPGPRERSRLLAMAARPLLPPPVATVYEHGVQLEEDSLLWRYRNFVRRDARLLIPFLRCVVSWRGSGPDAVVAAAQREAFDVLHAWRAMSFATALLCLGREFSDIRPIRAHAILALEQQSNDVLSQFAMNLVRCVAYDSAEKELATFLVQRAVGSHWMLCSSIFWALVVEVQLEAAQQQQQQQSGEPHPGVGAAAPTTTPSTPPFANLLALFHQRLLVEQPILQKRLMRQRQLHRAVHQFAANLRRAGSDRATRERAGQRILAKGSGSPLANLFSAVEEVEVCGEDEHRLRITSPLHPNIGLRGVSHTGFGLFKSATEPMRLTFLTKNKEGDDDGGAEELSVMIKFESVRQDQLVVQMILLADDLLRQDGLDLHLTPYRIVATGPHQGWVELVPHVATFHSIQRDVHAYLQQHNPTPEAMSVARERFTRSLAGYAVLTYIFGIGDRHLDNILLARDGRILHVDFGFILGHDPKPFAPLMRLTREMISFLGGPESEAMHRFQEYGSMAYLILRRGAPVLLHSLWMMADAADMPQLSSSPAERIDVVRQRLRLELSSAQATQHVQGIMASSTGSLFANLWDAVHAAAQATRA